MPKIVHYRNKCIGCNSCVEYSPNNWKISSNDGKSDLIGSVKKKDTFVKKIREDEIVENELAARDCPVKIIHIFK